MSQPEENKVIIDGLTRYGGLNQPNLKFVKVNVDCWDQIFDLLSLRDILAMSQTCQRMRQIGGHYFRENFHGTACELSDSTQPKFYTANEPIELERDDFLRFIDTASIYGELKHLQHSLNLNLLTSLTTVRLWYMDLNEQDIVGFNNNQRHNSIECIELSVCTIYGRALQHLLEHCPNVKCLRIERIFFESTASANDFFQQKYPKLEQFQYSRRPEIDAVADFLEQNPNIKWFSTDVNDLWTGGHLFLLSNVQLDCLTVDVYSDEIKAVAIEFADFLRTLYERRFFKKLHLVVTWPLAASDYRVFLNEMIRFDALEMLCTFQFHGLGTARLIQLKELHIRDADVQIDLEILAKNLKRLERLWIQGTNEQIILPFIRHSGALKIAIVRLADGELLNLFKMDQERGKLEYAMKISIGVPEENYLNIKCMSRQCHSSLVEIVREETVHEHFEYISQYVEF